jgi:S1-C subfamily serine protease
MWVTIGSGEGEGVSVRVEGERFLVGQGDECQLKLGGDANVATLHAYFEVEPDGRVLLHDLGSDQGTLVDGARIDAPKVIEGGERIQIGDTLLTPSVDSPEEEARARAAALLHEDSRDAPVRVRTDEGDVIEVVPEHGDGEEGPHLRVRSEGAAVEVAPVGEHRRLRERIGVATGLAVLAGFLAVTGLVVFLATRDEDAARRSAQSVPTTTELVSQARPRTVLIDARTPEGESGGSGFVLDAKKGLVVTNFHVVNGGRNLLVGVDGDIRDASLFSAAPCDDLAILQVEDESGLEDLPLGDQEKVKEGDRVIAVGYPANASLDANLASTEGVVSVARTTFRAPSKDGPAYPNVVQTDAAINPGNSGGPLIGEDGKLVGVNAAVFQSAGGSPIQGQGYAIGVDRVKEVLETLETGKSEGYAGFGIAFPPGAGKAKAALAVPMAGLGGKPFVLTEVNGTSVQGTYGGYCDAVRPIESGDTAVLTVASVPRAGAATRQMQVEFR